MNVKHFLDTLPEQFNDWGLESVNPKNRDMLIPLDGTVWILGNSNTAALMNYATGCMDINEKYLEVGVLQGATLTCALQGNNAKAWAVDNFSDWDSQGKNKSKLIEHIDTYKVKDRVEFFFMDSKDFFRNPPTGRVGVYFYDAAHEFMATSHSIIRAIPSLSDNALIVVDDYQFRSVRRSVKALVRKLSCLKLVLELGGESQTSWWNHLALLEYNRF